MLARTACNNGASSLSVLRVVRPWDRLRVMARGGPRSSCASTSVHSSTTSCYNTQLGCRRQISTLATNPPPSPRALNSCSRCSVFTTAVVTRPRPLPQLKTLNPAMSATQTRGHGHGHGHGHHHHHGTDPSLLLSKDKSDAAVRITRLGLLLNVVLAVGKGFAGYYWNSKSAFSPPWTFPPSNQLLRPLYCSAWC